MSKKVIINADDFGLSKVFNEVMLDLLENKLITSTTAMVDFLDEKQEFQINKLISLQKKNNFGIGLHLVFQDENFEIEIQRQYNLFQKIFKFLPSHLDIHKPSLFPSCIQVVEKYCIKNKISFRNKTEVKSEFTTTNIYLNGTELNFESLREGLLKFKDDPVSESIEILFHPGKFDPESKSSLNEEREADVFKIIKLVPFLLKNNFTLCHYLNLNLYDKNFDVWNNLKKRVHNEKIEKFFREGEIWWCHLGINLGFEQDGKGYNFERPVFIFKKFNQDIFLGFPLSSNIKSSKFYFDFNLNNIQYCVILSQLKLFDRRRLIRKIDVVSLEISEQISQKFQELISKRNHPLRGGISEA